MNPQWQQFLATQQARIDEHGVRDFGEPQAELAAAADNVKCDLSHYGLIAVSGDDAVTFMQGQFSNDVTLVDDAHSQLSSYNNPKGRCLACFRLFRQQQRYLLRLPREVLAPTLQRLRMFVLRSAVVLEDVSDELASMGLSGPAAEAFLARDQLAPTEVDGCLQGDGFSVLRVAGAQHPRFELHGQAEALQQVWQQARDFTTVGRGTWRLLEIEAGLPEVFLASRESFVPQMLNLDRLGGISFTKGCYTGQEIVARMHYLGKLKKRMYLAEVRSPHTPAVGDKLYAAQGDTEQSIGEVVNRQSLGQERHKLLAVIRIDAAEAGDIHLDSPTGPRLSLQTLPYAISEQES